MPAVFYSDYWSMLLVMLAGGITGGIVNYFLSPTAPAVGDPPAPIINPPYLWRCIIVGIGASLIVPVFLYLTRSELLTDLKLGSQLSVRQPSASPTSSTTATVSTTVMSLTTNPPARPLTTTVTTTTASSSGSGNAQRADEVPAAQAILQGYLVFFSLCVLAAVSGFGFIPSMTGRLLASIREVKQSAEQAKAELKTQKVQLDGQKQLARTLIQRINENPSQTTPLQPLGRVAALSVAGAGVSTRDQSIAEGLAQPVKQPTDPQKGRWGGEAESDNYRLQATVRALDEEEQYFTVALTVMAVDPAQKPLTGDVAFFLHNKLAKSQQDVAATSNQAKLELLTWGCFTVGAVTNNGESLELDLATLADAPPRFRSQTVG